MERLLNKTAWLLVVVLAIGVLLAGASVIAGEEEDEEIMLTLGQITSHAKITLTQAVALAIDQHAGRAVEAEFEGEMQDGQIVYFYDVKVAEEGGTFYELSIDPVDGHVFNEEIDDEEEDAAERQNMMEAAAAARIDLAACIDKAVLEGKGHVFAAALEMDEGEPICEAVSAAGKRYYEIEVSLLDGDVLEVDSSRNYGEENEADEGNETNETDD